MGLHHRRRIWRDGLESYAESCGLKLLQPYPVRLLFFFSFFQIRSQLDRYLYAPSGIDYARKFQSFFHETTIFSSLIYLSHEGPRGATRGQDINSKECMVGIGSELR